MCLKENFVFRVDSGPFFDLHGSLRPFSSPDFYLDKFKCDTSGVAVVLGKFCVLP